MDPFTRVTVFLGANLEFTGSHPGLLSPQGPCRASLLSTHIYFHKTGRNLISSRGPFIKDGGNRVGLQSCEKVNMSMAGLRCISSVKTGDQDLGTY